MRIFNTAGLCFPEDHYMIDPLRRIAGTRGLIRQKKYFSLHAPRQTGKTTSMRALMQYLNAEGGHIALHFSCEAASVTGENYAAGNRILVDRIRSAAKSHLPEHERPPPIEYGDFSENLLGRFLEDWARTKKKPLVLFFDEIDSLSDLTLISVLRQLRDGYQNRPYAFPKAVGLIGLKDVRDYRVKLRDEHKSMGTASPFNIKDKSLTLQNFTKAEVAELYAQHTTDTGQPFTEGAFAAAFHYTQGQPWLINALARKCVEDSPKADTNEAIDEGDIFWAKEQLILERATHLDSLLGKLREERVRRVIDPILAGELLSRDVLDDDQHYVFDLGLVVAAPNLKIANPMYQEIIPRALNANAEKSIPETYHNWLDDEGKLDWPRIWEGFLEFWRENGGALIQAQSYPEAAPHLVLMAYLQRFANSRGHIIREYAIGRGRMDLLVKWPYECDGHRHWQREAIELKVWHPGKKDPLEKGLSQLTQYLSGLGMESGTLVIFDRREGLPPLEDRVSREFTEFDGRRIQLIRG